MTGQHPRGTCAHCGDDFAMITGGVLGAHASGGLDRCPGAGKPPAGTELAALVARLAEATAGLMGYVEAGVHPDGAAMPPGEEMMSLAQVARAFNRTTVTVRRWTRDGKLGTVLTPGGSRLYRRSEVDRLLRGEDPADKAPPALTLVLPDNLTETAALRGMAEAIRQVHAALTDKAARFREAAGEWRTQGDSYRESLCEVQARVCLEDASYIEEELVRVFDLRGQYPPGPHADPSPGPPANPGEASHA